MNFVIILCIVGAYLIGSVSPAYIYYKKLTGKDIRKAGDKNPGSANIRQLAGASPAFVIALIDFCKGILPLLVAKKLGVSDFYLIFVAVAAVAGHDWPLFLGFRGGKGTLTSLGVMVFYLPFETILAFIVWLFIHYIIKTRFIGSLITFVLIPILTWFISVRWLGNPVYYLLLPLIILVFFSANMSENISNFFKTKKN